ncbi:MAG: hypothetical protein C3F07_01175 [Anaerolineales bacterium]|nr:hypothetical protein [Anaerolineae bacterium]PWB77953.1 MAG: hypothetical protein C3F07_01175 [Anaerolineales bacterium]
MGRNSIASNWRVDHRLLLAVAALIGVAFFLVVSALTYRIGFPLDDAWIHLTYARNLAGHGEWAFRLGERSAGSTAPLWTALLAIGYLLKLAPHAWTYLLGWIVLSGLSIYAEQIARRAIKSYRTKIPWVGLFMALEWHLTWSATSGMETLLHGLIVLLVLGQLILGSRQYLTLGLLTGLSVWVRPDGLTLLGPILFAVFLQEGSMRARGDAFVKTLIGFGALFVPNLVFNLALSGTPMPNTFYAKQAEYEAYWLSKPLADRITDYVLPMIASPFVVLVPGTFLWLHRTFRERNWGALAGVGWFLGYVGIYFMRLPAYQHGRYIIPALPMLYVWGLLGLMQYVTSSKANQRIVFLWQVVIIALVLSFQFVGALQNAQDVVLIETQMVRTARWMNENLPPDSILAVHDIGAIGYFAHNPLIDLAGLITPDVVPFIRDEARLAEYLDSKNVDYLVTIPGWYPGLVENRNSVFEAGVPGFPFDENMRVYRWR